MGIGLFINSKTLDMKFSQVIHQYDTDDNGFTKDEFINAFNGITTRGARVLAKILNFENSVFDDLNSNKDKIVTYDEMAALIKREYKLNFYDFFNMDFKDVCNEIDKARKNNKKSSNSLY